MGHPICVWCTGFSRSSLVWRTTMMIIAAWNETALSESPNRGCNMYDWRKLSQKQRCDLLAWRRRMRYPWHSPQHRTCEHGVYHITASCYEHNPIIGNSPARMADFATTLADCINAYASNIHAWCVLPNHYHVLISTAEVIALIGALGKMHGRTSFAWNGVDVLRGQQVWCKAVERGIRSDRHHWATMNYVHNNPVHHGYTRYWQEWPYSSASDYLASVGIAEAQRIWNEYPVLDYGKGWDDTEM